MPKLNSFKKTCVALAVGQLICLPVKAATIQVDSQLDDNGALCTLRQAVVSINSASLQGGCQNASANAFGSDDTIEFNLSGSQTIGLTSKSGVADLVIGNGINITIDGGSGTTIIGSATKSIFFLSNSTLSLNDVTVTGGTTTSIGSGGAIYAKLNSSVILTDSVLSNNKAFKGGAIFSQSSYVSITDSNISDNSSSNFGGGIHLSDTSSLTFNNSTLSGNSSNQSGAGIYSNNSSASLTNGNVSGNSATNNGGGIFAKGNVTSISLSNSTVSGNSATNNGGGIFANGNVTSISLSNSTVSANSATRGGGLYANGTASVSLTNSTVSGNSASNSGGGIYANDANANIINSLIAGNLAPTSAEISNIGFAIIASYSLFGDDSYSDAQAFSNFNPTGNITTTSDGTAPARLADILIPLADNGGPTLTHALVSRSPAVNAAAPLICNDIVINGVDQRGLPRDLCDIGAYAQQPATVITVNDAGDTSGGADCTLRDAILASNTDAVSGGCDAGNNRERIVFDTGANTTITLSSALPVIESSVTIDGSSPSGVTIDANSTGRVLSVENSKVSLNNLTLTEGLTLFNGGGLYVRNFSTVTLSNSTVTDNSANTNGGGLLVDSNSTINVNGSTLSNNKSEYGGGVHVRFATINLSNSTVSGNSAINSGGGIFSAGGSLVNLSNTTVTDNSASGSGGIFTFLATVEITNSLITGNNASSAAEFNNNGSSSSVTTNHNLFGDSGHNNFQAFVGFMPGSTDMTATSDGTQPTILSGILNPLDNNGGVTQTHALVSASPAINAANNVACNSATVNGLDQRGKNRDNKCDIGSYEFIDDSMFVVPLKNGKVVVFSL